MTKRILIVDDEEDIVQLVRLILEDAGYKVGTATDSRSVVERLAKEPFDLVLLDIMMPFFSGWQILRQLRDHPDTRSLPVAMLTARASPREDYDSNPTDYCDYIIKPFEPDDLVRRVGRILSV